MTVCLPLDMENDYPSGTDPQEMAKLTQYPLDTYNPNLIKEETAAANPAKVPPKDTRASATRSTSDAEEPSDRDNPQFHMGPGSELMQAEMGAVDGAGSNSVAASNYIDWSLNFLIDPYHDLADGLDLHPSALMSAVPFEHEEKELSGEALDLLHRQHATNPSIGPNVAMAATPGMASSRRMAQNHSMAQNMAQNPAQNMAQSMNQSMNQGMNQIMNQSMNQSMNQQVAQGTTASKLGEKRRPCDHCRRRKTKCVIIPGTNTCAQCEAKSIACTSSNPRDENAAKRMRTLEYGNMPLGMNMGPPMSQEVIPPNVPLRNVAPVQDYSTMNKSLLKKTLSLQYPRSSFYVGPTSYLFDVNLLDVVIGSQEDKSHPPRGKRINNIEQVNLSESISLRKVENKTQFVLKDDQSRMSFQSMSNDVDTIEKFIAPHGQILIDLYFRIIHPSYPILHKKVFLEKYSRTHREFSAPLLGAVYVLAIQWWDYDPQLSRFPKPNVELILKIALNNYILEILKRPKLSAVQAGLLLLQSKHILTDISVHNNAQTSSSSLASASLSSSFNESDFNDWVLCSQIVALSEELGLGLDCDTWKLPKWERGLRKRLAWAVYLEEKWLSLKNSRPSHIHEANWVVSHLAEEDFPEKHGDGDLKEGSSDITNGKKNFMNLIELSKILSDICSSLFSMKAMKEVTDINEVLRIAKPIQLRLRKWYHSLPAELQMNSVQPRKLCSNGYLQLAYFAAELTLHRKIITTLYQQGTNGSKVPDELLNVCRSAARSRLLASMEFVRDLKPEHIHSFWHSSASANFTLIGTFASLLFISSTTKEEADFYKEHIFNYRWILKISSKGFAQVCDSLRKLDLVLNHIPGLSNDTSDQGLIIPDSVDSVEYSKAYQVPNQMPAQQQYINQLELQGALPSHSQRLALVQKMQNQLPQVTSFSPVPPDHGAYQHNANGHVKQQYTNSSQNLTPKDSNRPSPVLHFKSSTQNVQSPYGSPQSFQNQMYTSGSSNGPGKNVDLPQSSQGYSPKNGPRQKRLVLSRAPSAHDGSQAESVSSASNQASPTTEKQEAKNA